MKINQPALLLVPSYSKLNECFKNPPSSFIALFAIAIAIVNAIAIVIVIANAFFAVLLSVSLLLNL